MRRVQIAEWILTLFTSRERAAAVAGDFIESASHRGVFWFWSAVFRTALSLFWRSFAAEPYSLAKIGFQGFILNVSLVGLGGFICFFLVFAPLGLLVADGLVSASALQNFASPPAPIFFSLTGDLVLLAVCFQTGRWMARRARDREMAAIAAFLIIQTITMPIVGELLSGGRWIHLRGIPPQHIAGLDLLRCNLESMIALFAGAAWVRRRILRERPSQPAT